LATYDLLPPPETIQIELGEKRMAKSGPIHIAFAPSFNMDHPSFAKIKDKTTRRKERADAIWSIVHNTYKTLEKL
jgi:glycerol-3-phosphate O-acyltransferase